MRNNFIRNISANIFQLVINQVFGLVIFYELSKGLDKNTFGQLNWALAVLLTIFNILSCGIDQLSIKKIAAGENARSLVPVYLFHVLFSGFLFYCLLIVSHFVFPDSIKSKLLLFIGIGKLMIYFSTPFKNIAMGFEKFHLLLYMTVCSNVIRGTGLIILGLFHNISLQNIIIIFITGDLIELLLCVIISEKKLRLPVVINWDKQYYVSLLRESYPQLGVAIFSSALARFDWILIGTLTTGIKLAEYSFAYKVFEVSTLPLLVIAPILIPVFTRIFKAGREENSKRHALDLLLRVEMMIASFIGLTLYLSWVPVIDYVTAGKYGAVNAGTILILSFSMPLLYINNFFWTVNFAKGYLKMIFNIIAISVCVNIAGDIILIPLYKNEGAALAYLLALLVQAIVFIRKSDFTPKAWRLLASPACALIAGLLAKRFFIKDPFIITAAVLIYLLSLLILRQFRLSDYKAAKNILHTH